MATASTGTSRLADQPQLVNPGSESQALQSLGDFSSAVEHSLDYFTLPPALSQESYMDPALEAAFNQLGGITQEMRAFYHTAVQARLVVCYGTVTDIMYKTEMIYFKIQDSTGQCVLRIIRTHDEVEPRIHLGVLPGISVGVSICVLAVLRVTHNYGGHDITLVSHVSPWVVDSTSISQHIRYADTFLAYVCRTALADLASSAMVNSQYISLAIEEGLLAGWVTEHILEPDNLSWTSISP
ncbi:hypothetical protein LXA43DRAFT_1066488 [Ganoderma leucocontextum]|nr:hypothetical protein LXA43DRAFT_1066488 [Ganoderma leucocontextum]